MFGLFHLLLDSELETQIPDTKKRCNDKANDALLESASNVRIVVLEFACADSSDCGDKDKHPGQERDESGTGNHFRNSAFLQHLLVYLVRSIGWFAIMVTILVMTLGLEQGAWHLFVLLLVDVEFFVMLQFTVMIVLVLGRWRSTSFRRTTRMVF